MFIKVYRNKRLFGIFLKFMAGLEQNAAYFRLAAIFTASGRLSVFAAEIAAYFGLIVVLSWA